MAEYTRDKNAFTQNLSAPATREREGVINGGPSAPVADQGAILRNGNAFSQALGGGQTTLAPVDHSIPPEERRGLQQRPVLPPPAPDQPRASITEAQRAGMLANDDASMRAADPAALSSLRQQYPPPAPGTQDAPLNTSPGALTTAAAARPAGSQDAPLNTSPGSLLTGQTPVVAPAGDPGAIIRKGNSFSQAPGTGLTDKPAREPGALLTGTQPAPAVDAFGNSTARTQQYQGQLDQLRAGNAEQANAQLTETTNRATANALSAPVQGTDYQSQKDAEQDRFTRFVNESSTATQAHDLGTGGSAKDQAGKIAALQVMQQRDAAARNDEANRSGRIQQGETAKSAMALQSKGQQLSYDTATKGQQKAHDTAMAQIVGSPLHQQGQAIDAAIKAGTLDTTKALQDLQKQLLAAKTPDEQARTALLIRQIQGQTPASPFKAMHLAGGVDAMGMKTADHGYVINEQTGEASPIGGNAAPAFTAGKTYTDAKGSKAVYQADGSWKEVK